MKPRNREINIFNMSLLDILCGALGTFCFMMLVLFPFYSQDKGKGKRPEVQEGVDPKTFEEAKARIQQLETKLKEFQGYADQLEARVKQLEAQARQRQGDMQQMQQRVGQAEMRNPMLVVGTFTMNDDEDLQLWIDSDRTFSDHSPVEKFDPARRQSPGFNGDMAASGPGSRMAYFLLRDTPPGAYRVYAKILKCDPGHTLYASMNISGNGFFQSVVIQANRDHMAVPVAKITVANDFKATLQLVVPPENQVKQ